MEPKKETFTFEKLPETEQEMKELYGDGTSEYRVAALAVLALTKYETDPNMTEKLLNVLKGPQPMSAFDRLFIKDRLSGKGYKPRSFFNGATPENGYTPQMPYTVSVSSNPYSYKETGYATLYLKSSGADSERPVKLRCKGSTGEWFLWEITFLADIREPASSDPWA